MPDAAARPEPFTAQTAPAALEDLGARLRATRWPDAPDERIVLEAKRLLSHADSSVAEIATQPGFADPSNFSTYFHRRTGLTPGAFRGRGRATGP